MFLVQFFVKNAKSELRTLFERPKSDKNRKSGKYRNPIEQREKWAFLTFKIPKLCHFSRYPLEIVTCVHLIGFFNIYSDFLIRKFTSKFFENIFKDYFQNYQNFENRRQQYD